MPVRHTLAPSATNARAVAMPMLPSPPVMNAVLPRSRSMRPCWGHAALDVLHASARCLFLWARLPVVARAYPVSGLEQPAEVRRIRVAPACADGGHRTGLVAQVAGTVFEAALPDPAGHRGAAGVEQLVQLAQRDVVRYRDLGGAQIGLGQVFFYVRGYVQHLRSVHGVHVLGC